MKNTLPNIKYYLTHLLAFFAIQLSIAQTVHHEFKLKKGEEYQRQVLIRSNSLLQRGSQKLSLSTYSDVTKVYKVNSDNNGRETVSITVNKILDSVNALSHSVEDAILVAEEEIKQEEIKLEEIKQEEIKQEGHKKDKKK